MISGGRASMTSMTRCKFFNSGHLCCLENNEQKEAGMNTSTLECKFIGNIAAGLVGRGLKACLQRLNQIEEPTFTTTRLRS